MQSSMLCYAELSRISAARAPPGDPASTAQNLHPTQHGPGSALYLVNLPAVGHTPITATALRYTLSRSLASAPRSNISHA